MKKVTKKEMFEAIINVVNGEATEITMEEIVEFAFKEIEALERKAAKAKERAAEKRAETNEIYTKVLEQLTEEYQTIAVITQAVNDPEITIARTQYQLNQLFKNGIAEKDYITIPAKDGMKSRKVVAFKLSVE